MTLAVYRVYQYTGWTVAFKGKQRIRFSCQDTDLVRQPSYAAVSEALAMSTVPTRVLDEGRVTIPYPVRDELELEKGDYVLIDVQRLDGRDE